MDGTNHLPGKLWAEFFLTHRRALTAYALSLVANPADAEDLIQEVLLRMVQRNQAVRNAKPYVLRSMRNLAIDRLRSSVKQPPMATVDNPEIAFIDEQVNELAARETAEQLKAALQNISTAQREIIVLKIYGEMPFREIADIVDRPIGSVTSTYARGLEELRQIYGKGVENVG